ncbi:MAG: DUF485 domain-containing protein [Steroidobacteraceae bacterium]
MTLAVLSRQRWRIAGALSAVMIVIYFGFVLLVAFDKPLLGTLLAPGLSLGVLIGALVIVTAWVLTWCYVRWANAHLDRRVNEIRAADRSGS